jgi:hypothetical protein
VLTLKDHLAALPTLLDDGMLEAPSRILRTLATQVETGDAADLNVEQMDAYEDALLDLSRAVADRYFLQGANAVPTAKLVGLA